MSDHHDPPPKPRAWQMGEAKEGHHGLFALPFIMDPKASNGKSAAELEASVAKFATDVGELLERPEYSSIEIAANGEQAMIALSTAFRGQMIVAEASAAQRARNN